MFERNAGIRTYASKDIFDILIDRVDVEGKICCSVPINVEHNCTFVVDTSKLKCNDDVRSDDCGVWRNNGVRPCIVSWKKGDATVLARGATKCRKYQKNENEYYLERTYFVHKKHGDFRKIITTIRGMSNKYSDILSDNMHLLYKT